MSDERGPAAEQPEHATSAEPTAPVPQSPPVHDVWDPWAPPARTAAPDPDREAAREPYPHTAADVSLNEPTTQELHLSHTQQLDELGGRTDTANGPEAPDAPVWAQQPTGWPAGQHQPAAAGPFGLDPYAAQAAAGGALGQGLPPQGAPPQDPQTQTGFPPLVGAGMPPVGSWDPVTADHADAGYPGQQPQWTGHQPAVTAPHQKGPGWGALVGVAAVAALVAAIVGGMFGGWLGATHRVDFSGLDRTPSSIPSVGAGATARPSGTVANIAAKALPSVVTIKVKGADGAGTGSGFVLDRDGHIVTNNHVVSGAADGGTITVELANGSEIQASIQGRDASYDLAVLKTGRSDLAPLTMGSSKNVVVGDEVIAMGAPLGLESTVTAGIVSALNRPVSPGGDGNAQSFINAIQTDAAINPGNSGGPLLNMQGQVIGVNSAIARVPGSTDTQSGNIGVGFSIPSDQVVTTAEQLIRTGKAQHPIIGVILDRQYEGDGVRILAQKTAQSGDPVDPKGPAGLAGVRPGDVILEFDGRRVSAPDDLVVAIRAKTVGDRVSMKVRRGSQTITVTLTLSGTSGS